MGDIWHEYVRMKQVKCAPEEDYSINITTIFYRLHQRIVITVPSHLSLRSSLPAGNRRYDKYDKNIELG